MTADDTSAARGRALACSAGPTAHDLQALHAKRLVLFGVSNKQVGPAQKAEATALFAAEVLPHLASGRIKPLVDSEFAFDDLPAARARMEANAHVGKIVVVV